MAGPTIKIDPFDVDADSKKYNVTSSGEYFTLNGVLTPRELHIALSTDQDQYIIVRYDDKGAHIYTSSGADAPEIKENVEQFKAQIDAALAASQKTLKEHDPLTLVQAQHDNEWKAIAEAHEKATEEQLATAMNNDKAYMAAVSAVYGDKVKGQIDALQTAREKYVEAAKAVLAEQDAAKKVELQKQADAAREAMQKARADLLEAIQKADPKSELADKLRTQLAALAAPDPNDPGKNPVLPAVNGARQATKLEAKIKGVDDWAATATPDGVEFKKGDYSVKFEGDKPVFYDKSGAKIADDKVPADVRAAFDKANEGGKLKNAATVLADVTKNLTIQADHFARGSADVNGDDQAAIQKQLQAYADAVKAAIDKGIDPATIKATLAINGVASKYGGTDDTNTKLAAARGDKTLEYAKAQWADIAKKAGISPDALNLVRGQNDVIGTEHQAAVGGIVDPAKLAKVDPNAAPAPAPNGQTKPDPNAGTPAPTTLEFNDKGELINNADNQAHIQQLVESLKGRGNTPSHLRVITSEADPKLAQAEADFIQKAAKGLPKGSDIKVENKPDTAHPHTMKVSLTP